MTQPHPAVAELRQLITAAHAALRELDAARRRLHAEQRFWFHLGYRHGHDVGYGRAETDMAAAWNDSHTGISAMLNPSTAPARVRAAEAESRRMARRHEAEFVARARRTPPAQRTLVQAAAVALYDQPAPRQPPARPAPAASPAERNHHRAQ